MTERIRWVVNAPTAVSEILDGELVVMNLKKGTYYSSEGVGAYLWQCIDQRVEPADIEAALVAAFNLPADRACADLDAFISVLRSEGLVRPADPQERLDGTASAPSSSAYAPPDLKIYSDMQDLLLLDPIHDVGEAGWPTRPSTDAA
jgi:hypothetical protein